MTTAAITPEQDWFSANAPAVQKGSSGDWFADNSPSQDQPGWLDREIPITSYGAATESGVQSIARGVRDAVKSTLSLIDPRPQNDEEQAALSGAGGNPASLPVYRILRSIGHSVQDATEVAGAIHDINQSRDPLGTYAKVAQDTAGQGAGAALTALATEGAARVLPKIPSATATAARTVSNAAKETAAVVRETATPENIATAVGGAVGGKLGAMAGEPLGGAAAGATVGRAIGKTVAKRMAARAAAEDAASDVATAADDTEGVTSPQIESASETPIESEPAQSAQPEAQPAKVDASPKAVESALEQALGVKKPVPGVPLKNQASAQAATAAKAESLPEGFTPVDSRAIKGYKYNPDAQELETIDAKTGTHYIHGGVTPEDFGRFASADSKGSAWNALKNNGAALVAKVINGKRIAVKVASTAKAAD